MRLGQMVSAAFLVVMLRLSIGFSSNDTGNEKPISTNGLQKFALMALGLDSEVDRHEPPVTPIPVEGIGSCSARFSR